jgi:hypothetical protein
MAPVGRRWPQEWRPMAMIFQMKTAPCDSSSSAKTSFAGVVVVDPAGSQTDIKHGKASHTAVQSSVLEEVGVLAFALCITVADLLNRRSLGISHGGGQGSFRFDRR